HKRALPEDVFKAILPIYGDLSNEDLLTRCIGGYTQNANESYNNLIWKIAPKTMASWFIFNRIAVRNRILECIWFFMYISGFIPGVFNKILEPWR
ncbi:hypothetical protein WH47_05564, partial [Habropoda laboriosa]